jgi:hypothetical protein
MSVIFAASSRWLLHPGRLIREPGRARNRRRYPADSAVAGSVPLRRSSRRGRAVATKSSQTAATAHSASDAASSRWLLRPACLIWTSDRARNRRHVPADSAVAGSVVLRCLLARKRAAATKSSRSATRAHSASDAAPSRWLLRPGCLTQTSERDRNHCHVPADSAVPGFSAFAGSTRRRRVSAAKSRQTAARAHSASDAASSRWLLRSGCLTRTSEGARNRRRYRGDSAVAG